MNADKPAFPRPASETQLPTYGEPERYKPQTGMTLREYAAVHILAGCMAGPAVRLELNEIVAGAVAHADALLSALERTKK